MAISTGTISGVMMDTMDKKKSIVEDAPDRLRFTYPMYYLIFITFALFVNWTITHFEGCSPQLLHFALLALWLFVELATEYFVMWFFEDEISPFKRLKAAPGGLPKLKTFIHDIFSIIVMDIATDLCTEYSIPLPEHQSLSWKPLELIDLPGLYFLFKLSWLLLNVFGYEVAHTMLHDMKFYHLHKHHHKVRKEVSMLNASFQFDFFDYFLEQKVGQILVRLLAYYFPGWIPVPHTVYFMINIHAGLSVHSCNPFTTNCFDPLHDYFVKCNMRHNLHHAVHFTSKKNNPAYYINSDLPTEQWYFFSKQETNKKIDDNSDRIGSTEQVLKEYNTVFEMPRPIEFKYFGLF